MTKAVREGRPGLATSDINSNSFWIGNSFKMLQMIPDDFRPSLNAPYKHGWAT